MAGDIWSDISNFGGEAATGLAEWLTNADMAGDIWSDMSNFGDYDFFGDASDMFGTLDQFNLDGQDLASYIASEIAKGDSLMGSGIWDTISQYGSKAVSPLLKALGIGGTGSGTGLLTGTGKGSSGLGQLLSLLGLGGASWLQSENASQLQGQILDYLKESDQSNVANWLKYAFPSQAEITQSRNEGMAKLGTSRNQAYENLATTGSRRGFGTGSGMLAKGAGEIEKGYHTSQGDLENALTKLQYKPRFGFPFSSTAGQGAGALASTGSWDNPLGMALGMMMYQNMLGGK